MNVWIFNHYATAPYHVGGTRHYDLAYQLIKRGHKVTIFASSYNHFLKEETSNFDRGSNYKKEKINGVDYVWIKTVKYKGSIKRIANIIDYTIKAYKTASNELKTVKPDIIIGSSVHPLAAYVGYLISRKAKSVFYFEERDLWPQTFVDFGKLSRKSPIAKLLYWFEKFLYKKAKRIMVLFDKADEYVASRGINRNKVIYLPNGVNINNYKELQDDNSILNLMQQFKYKYKVIYTGSHGIANYLEPLIETANIIQNVKGNLDIQFILVGNGPLKSDLMELAKSYNLNNVTFIDSITKGKIPCLLNQADLSFISLKKSPLYKWGFSMNKLYDYMASGLPIMMYSSKEVIGDLKDVSGVNLSDNPNNLADAIVSRIYDEEYKIKTSYSLKRFVEENYSWEKLALKVETYMLNDLGKEIHDDKVLE